MLRLAVHLVQVLEQSSGDAPNSALMHCSTCGNPAAVHRCKGARLAHPPCVICKMLSLMTAGNQNGWGEFANGSPLILFGRTSILIGRNTPYLYPADAADLANHPSAVKSGVVPVPQSGKSVALGFDRRRRRRSRCRLPMLPGRPPRR